VAYTVLGLAAGIGRRFKKPSAQLVAGMGSVLVMRFLCSFTSGILLWGEYAPEGFPVWLYSLTYNGGYMSAELILT
ncbi:MAG: energy-coupled thiamine transporter ThiT, partial [Oscillospiraceae bacterium]